MTDSDMREAQALEMLRTKRSKPAAGKTPQPLPSFVKQIEACKVSITINPDWLPYKLADAQTLLHEMTGKYKLHYKTPPPHVIPAALLAKEDVSEADILDSQLNSGLEGDDITFEDGAFVTGANQYVSIYIVVFTGESIYVSVLGHTYWAEKLVGNVFESLWKASGVTRQWESEDVQRHVQLKQYSTSTKVELGFRAMEFIDQRLRDYIDKSVVSSQEYSGLMMPLSAFEGFHPCANVVACVSFDELDFFVDLFNSRTGRHLTAELKLSVMSRDEKSRGVVTVTSRLPLDQHVEFIRGLISSYAESKDK